MTTNKTNDDCCPPPEDDFAGPTQGEEAQEELAAFAKALGHPIRVYLRGVGR